jgi:hypothetical protein
MIRPIRMQRGLLIIVDADTPKHGYSGTGAPTPT